VKRFIEERVRQVERTPADGPGNREHALEMVSVEPEGVAWHLGVRPGDLLVAIDGRPAAQWGRLLGRHGPGLRTYEVWRAEAGERVSARIDGVPLGVKLAPTLEAVRAEVAGGEVDLDGLRSLWHRGRFEFLSGLLGPLVQPGGMWGWWKRLSGGELPLRDTPALLLWGAAEYELGRREQGMTAIRHYLDHLASDYTMPYLGIGAYYEALEADDLDGLYQAWETHPCDRIADAVVARGGERPVVQTSWEGQPLPVRYRLPRVVGEGMVDLDEVLAQLQPGEFVVLLLLATYRGNGPSDELLWELSSWQRAFGARIAGVHLLTMTAERRLDRPYWYEAEDAAVEAGVPLEVLLDDGAVHYALPVDRSPFVLCVDGSGRVLFEGELDERAIWRVVAAADEARGA
jgi:hypothetical protein